MELLDERSIACAGVVADLVTDTAKHKGCTTAYRARRSLERGGKEWISCTPGYPMARKEQALREGRGGGTATSTSQRSMMPFQKSSRRGEGGVSLCS